MCWWIILDPPWKYAIFYECISTAQSSIHDQCLQYKFSIVSTHSQMSKINDVRSVGVPSFCKILDPSRMFMEESLELISLKRVLCDICTDQIAPKHYLSRPKHQKQPKVQNILHWCLNCIPLWIVYQSGIFNRTWRWGIEYFSNISW